MSPIEKIEIIIGQLNNPKILQFHTLSSFELETLASSFSSSFTIVGLSKEVSTFESGSDFSSDSNSFAACKNLKIKCNYKVQELATTIKCFNFITELKFCQFVGITYLSTLTQNQEHFI